MDSKSIVIVNEYTVKTPHGGTRGGSPSDYVLDYMAREGAVETVPGVVYKNTGNAFSSKYDDKAKIANAAKSISEMQVDFSKLEGRSGVAFGYGKYTMSDSELKAAANDIHENFNKGKTVMKTVLSFDENFLKEHGLIEPDFKLKRAGDYRGHVDQLKLRMAIMSGLDKLSRSGSYDDLQYIGVIQVDTKHVHCHLAMVDRGEGTIMEDGTQRGKIIKKNKDLILNGVNQYLKSKQPVKAMSTSFNADKQNTACFVKKQAYKMIEDRGLAQFMIACLPDDKRLWIATSHKKEMRKPNSIVRSYVEDILSQPDSGYEEAMEKVRKSARSKMSFGKMSSQEYNNYCNNGRERIIEQSMNTVYSVLKQIPDSDYTVDTRMMSVMAMEYEDMANSIHDADDMMSFGFKLRSYKNRLDHHTEERHKYHDAADAYSKQKTADESSRVLYDYFKIEEQYNEMLMTKYQYFLDFAMFESEYKDELDEVLKYKERVENLDRMKNDTTVRRMSAASAEKYGLSVYGESGGQYIVTKPEIFDNKVRSVNDIYRDKRDAFSSRLADHGLSMDDNGRVVSKKLYDFNDVKALDLHHLTYDFPDSIDISVVNINRFNEMSDKRYEAFMRAKQYLVNTGQSHALTSFPEADINLQHALTERMRTGDTSFRSMRELVDSELPAKKTIRLDSGYYKNHTENMKNAIKSTVDSLQYE